MEIDKGIHTTYYIVLDCANIAHSYGVDHFNARGIHLAFSYFEHNYCSSRLNIIGFIKADAFKKRPRPSLNSNYKGNAMMETNQVDYLSDLERAKKISCVPPTEDDDVYILTESKKRDAFILSNDQFTDHQLRLLVDDDSSGNNSVDGSYSGDKDDKLGDFRDHIKYFKSGYTWVQDELRPYPASPMMRTLREIEINNCKCQQCTEYRMRP